MASEPKVPSVRTHLVGDLLKEGSQAIQSNALLEEDEFHGLYASNPTSQVFIEPPLPPRRLERLVQENNALSPSIDAMVANIAGTGWSIRRDEDNENDPANDKRIRLMTDFFEEPWPGQSYTTQYRYMLRQKFSIGYCFLEIMRNAKGDIAFARPIDAKYMRLVHLDDPIPVQVEVPRGSGFEAFTVMKRQRRFVQRIGNKYRFFKEFGAVRDLDKGTGFWAEKGQTLPLEKRATEILMIGDVPDPDTPYYLPRWLPQMPSVLGSRKAEETNLAFFDRGGVPPALVIVQGGAMAEESRKALEGMLQGGVKDKHQAAVLEAYDTSGSLDSNSSSVRVSVERFGSERVNDSLFETYLKNNEGRIRRSFRLPPLFVGETDSYNFATSYSSYIVAEAQSFGPERDEHDEVISLNLVRSMVGPGYSFRSKPLSIQDTETQMKAIEMAQKTQSVSPEDLIEQINDTANLDLIVSKNPEPLQPRPNEQPQDAPIPEAEEVSASGVEKASAEAIYALAVELMKAVRTNDLPTLRKVQPRVDALPQEDRRELNKVLSTLQFLRPEIDAPGTAELAGCTMAVMARNNA